MRTLNKDVLTPLQARALEVMQNQAQNYVTYFSYKSLAETLSSRRNKIHPNTAKRVLQYLNKKDRLNFSPGKSHQKGRVIFPGHVEFTLNQNHT